MEFTLFPRETIIKTELDKKLLSLLLKSWEDEEFIVGVFQDLETDENKRKLIDFIEEENETDSDVIILAAMDIADGIEV
jgi:hypothetical protein